LRQIAESEKLNAEPEALRMVARQAEGSMRDAQSLLDRVQSFCEGTITAAETEQVLGLVRRGTLFALSQAVLARDASAVLSVLDGLFSGGVDPTLFLKEFVGHWRELLIAKFGGEAALKRIGVSDDYSAQLLSQTAGAGAHDMLDLAQLAREGADAALRSTYPKYALEALLVRMSCRESVKDLGAILTRLKSSASRESAAATRAESEAPAAEGTSAPRRETAPRLPEPSAPEGQCASGAPLQASAVVEWPPFVQFAAQKGARMICEHLRRFVVVEFGKGILQAKGPEFSVAYFEQKENRERLGSLLSEYTQHRPWKVALSAGESGAQPPSGSLAAVEDEQRKKQVNEQVESLKNHPKVQSLKRVFPGSTIENIKLKE
jgi:hypothetical protein